MKKLIHHLRRQPEQTRRHILHILTVFAAIILFSLWVYSLQVNFTNSDTALKAKEDLKPLSALKDNLVGGYQSFSQSSSNTQ